MNYSDDKKIYRVFVASTWEDFKAEREKILEALRNFYYQHVTMEYFGADTRRPIEKCLDEVRSSDVFVGIIGHRYGTILDDTGKSYTHTEYEEAVKIGLPCLIYFRSDDIPILPKYFDRDQNSINKLEELKKKLLNKHTIHHFKYSDDLVVRVTSDISSLIQRIKVDDSNYSSVDTLSNKAIRSIDSYLAGTNERDKLLNSIMKHYGFYTEDDHKRIVEGIKKMSRAVTMTLAEAAERRDPFAAGHQKRVSILAFAIAKKLNFSVEQCEGVQMAGMIHDIGKVSIPSEILGKPTKMSGIEFNLLKAHAQNGYDILKEIEFPWPIARMVLEHHEKMNGSGYPNGLIGDDILMESRVLAVADTVEAVNTPRPYRPALGIEAALSEISRNKGTLYDPEVVNVCMCLFTEKEFAWE